MDEGGGIERSSAYSGSKSRVLDIKPLRSIAPVFPTQIPSQSFPFPHGFVQSVPQSPPLTPVAIPKHFNNSSFSSSALVVTDAVPLNENRSSKKIRKSSSSASSAINDAAELASAAILSAYDTEGIRARNSDGDKATVESILSIFNSLRRKISQIEEEHEQIIPGLMKRTDLKSGALLMQKKIRTNSRKRIGAVPGVQIGDIFLFRMEMCLVGIHSPNMAGIDYISVKTTDHDKNEEHDEILAISIVSSEGYEDEETEDGTVLIYSGHGGNPNNKGKEMSDQKLEKGNLAMENSLRRGNEVRVVRGIKDFTSQGSKIYVYDGLYRIHDSWAEKGRSGCNIFKYRLVRVMGQDQGFMLWRGVQKWRLISPPRNGVILPDLTSGIEKVPVTLVNDEDDEKGPPCFIYSPTLDPTKPDTPTGSPGCTCRGSCRPGDPTCLCVRRNGGRLPYTGSGVLVEPKRVVFECGSGCTCPPGCRNRVSQAGVRLGLEVFRTKEKGWGLRSRDVIRAGSFICEYSGEVKSTAALAPANAIEAAESTAAIEPAKSTAALEEAAKSIVALEAAKSTVALEEAAESTVDLEAAKSTVAVEEAAESTVDLEAAKSTVAVEAMKSGVGVEAAKSGVGVEAAVEEAAVGVGAGEGWSDDEYVFDSGRVIPEEAEEEGYGVVIRGRGVGNVARFMNHGCTPTVSWHIVARGSGIHVGFYAIRNIAPLEELTYEYGAAGSRTRAAHRKRECRCRSSGCRGYFYH